MEFIDVEGAGGARNEDDFIKKIETRSPHTRIDKAVIDFTVSYSENLYYMFEMRFDDRKARLDRHFLTYKSGPYFVEFGKNRPKISLTRETESYPLIGTAFWKGREYHLDVSREMMAGKLGIGASFALKRPLEYDDAAEDKSFKMLVYDDYEKLDGQTYEMGVRGKLSLGVVDLSGWYYYGKLIDDEDWLKRLHYDFDDYVKYEADNVLYNEVNYDHYWFGGRASVVVPKNILRAEYIYSKDGYLPRSGYYVEAGQYLKFSPRMENILLLARYGTLAIGGDFEPKLKDSHTWDRTMITLAAIAPIAAEIKLKMEYYFLDEKTGDKSVNDDQLLIQLEMKF